ncbi:MAG TPA: glycosyltransferase [Verrucomicrobiae bacterium]|nr:glycosyltransferase [Verrucomicrobiae bacterium]
MANTTLLKNFAHMDIMEIVGRVTGAALQLPRSKNRGAFSRRRIARRKILAPRISIIIPAHNEEHYLRHTLDALKRQSYRNFEVIVVANGCSDRTEDAARDACDRLVVLSQKSLGVARNLGARMAKGELLVFLDADTLLDPNALKTIAHKFTRRHAAGTIRGKPDSDRLAYRIIYGVKNLIHRTSLHHGSSGVILCWRRHFMKLGGFRENLEVRENSELIKRLERFGRYACISRAVAVTSMRRYEHRGVGRMVWMWTRLWFESLFRDLKDRKYETVR